MTVSPPSVAIFDFDGTLADSLGEGLVAYNSIAPDLNLPVLSSQELAKLRRLTPLEAMRELRVPYWKVPRIMHAGRSAMRARMTRLKPFVGVIDLLQDLWSRGVQTAIVSSNSEENVRQFLECHGIDRFGALSCGVSLFGKAPRLRKVAKRKEFAGAKLVYIGDEVRDVVAAKEAGLTSVAVTWGYGERAVLEAHGPHHLVETPAQLNAILVAS